MIDKFDGKYDFLSNFYECNIPFAGYNFTSSEAAFQAMKTRDPDEREQFENLGPGAAKRLGRKVNLRSDWEKVKDDIMYLIVSEKFFLHKDLREKLLATGEEELVEGNYWNDTYWGVCNGVGQNKLGKILMRVREEFHNGLR